MSWRLDELPGGGAIRVVGSDLCVRLVFRGEDILPDVPPLHPRISQDVVSLGLEDAERLVKDLQAQIERMRRRRDRTAA